jgi:hypothetical protein
MGIPLWQSSGRQNLSCRRASPYLFEELLPFQGQAAQESNGSRDTNRRKCVLDGQSNDVDSSGGSFLACVVNEIASHTRNGGGDFLGRRSWEEAMKTIVRLVDKDSAGYTSTHSNTKHLANGHKSNAVGSVRGGHLHLRDSEACLAVAADSDPKKDGIAVDFGVASGFIGRVCITLVNKIEVQGNAVRAGKLYVQNSAPPIT